MDEAGGKPDARAVVVGLGLDEEVGIDAALVTRSKAVVEALVETASTDEILKNTVRSLAPVAPMTKNTIVNMGCMLGNRHVKHKYRTRVLSAVPGK